MDSGGADGAAVEDGQDSMVSEGGQDSTVSESGNEAGSGDGGRVNLHWSSCPDGGSTTISGTVYDPANVDPIYSVIVYVPGVSPLPNLPSGASCGSCSELYASPLTEAITDPNGNFTISNAPDGSNIPLVVQVGKWRMEYTLNSVTACTDNTQPDHSLRLPKNHTEGNFPNIAISTGNADSLECLLLRMGVDPGEYTGGSGGAGRIHIFTGNLNGSMGAVTQGGTSPDPGTNLWDSDTDIEQYDVVLLSCEGGETANMNQKVLYDYGGVGGRVFASHFHYAWFDTGPFATMISPALATWTPTVELLGNINSNVVTTLPNGNAFPEGQALQKWLGVVGALGVNGAPSGELPIAYACHNSDVTNANVYSQQWISADKSSPSPGATQYFSFDMPIGTSAEGKCGRIVYSDLHVSGAPGASRGSLPPDYGSSLLICPDQCATGALSPQEKALEFMIFDLSSCLIPIGQMGPVVDGGSAIEDAGQGILAAPTFTPPSGASFTGPSTVTINAPPMFPASGFIYYTTNGTNPNPNSLVYVGPIAVSQAETIRAYASAPGYADSPIVLAMYTVN